MESIQKLPDLEMAGSLDNVESAPLIHHSLPDPNLDVCVYIEQSVPDDTLPPPACTPAAASSFSSFKQLGFLDRFLAIWIFLAMAIGIILGNFVPNTGSALQRGQFANVSIPIGTKPLLLALHVLMPSSDRPAGHDVPHPD